MKRTCMTDIIRRYIFGIVLLPVILTAQPATAVQLWGVAEDLWGDKIDLSKLQNGVVVIHPLSTSH
jgi:hypothetical protein